jgi:hypothetical protein
MALDGWRAYWAIKRMDWDFILQAHSISGDYLATLQKNQAQKI